MAQKKVAKKAPAARPPAKRARERRRIALPKVTGRAQHEQRIDFAVQQLDPLGGLADRIARLESSQMNGVMAPGMAVCCGSSPIPPAPQAALSLNDRIHNNFQSFEAFAKFVEGRLGDIFAVTEQLTRRIEQLEGFTGLHNGRTL